ncbi:hypothetical protein TWF102_008436 [Orbilia oligospora]|uniref:Myb-like DNA-binding domain-containing protein n=1 Tax=Orbilia oligospora TaxID=2813651 RepID=A0A7C8JES8_ORBOL|nr:hypothetical protein TWF102_008436 [Orbilia oligospora]KAF3119195.1 hypothetical protein TWF703_003585 [Orbilia oligospora]
MSSSGSTPKQMLSDSEFLLCCIDSISNGKIDYAAVAKAANYANDGRARARLSRINSKHGTRPVISKKEEEKTVEKQAKVETAPKDPSKEPSTKTHTKRVGFAEDKLTDDTGTDKAGRVTRSSASKVPASNDVKVKKKKPTSSA